MKKDKIKEKELWVLRVKEKLEDYSEPIPGFGWERLEKELAAPQKVLMSSTPGRTLNLRRRWASVAAAVVLLIASSVSVYFLNTPVADEIRYAVVPNPSAAPDKLPVTTTFDTKVAPAEPAGKIRPLVAAVRKKAERQGIEPSVPAEATAEQEAEQSFVMTEVKATDTVEEEQEQKKEERTEVRRQHKPSGRDKLHLPVGKTAKKGGRWSIGAGIGNAGGILTSGEGTGGIPYNGIGQRINLVDEGEGGTICIPGDQMVVFRDGVPYLQSVNEVVDMKHHQPVAFGLSVRKSLPKGFSVETGLTYTLLSSDVKLAGNATRVNQKLHYVGIPLRGNWNFLDKERFTLYVSAGGMVEKCVSGKLGSDNQTVDPLQFSVSGAVGAQYNATKRVGVYVEPGVAYFFDDGSDVQTIRKETPCNFNIQAGVRFTY